MGLYFYTMQNFVAVLYSKEQKCWHVETLLEYLLSNQRFLLDVTKVQQFRLVIVVNTRDEASEFIKKNRDMFKEDKSNWYNQNYKTKEDMDKAIEEWQN